LVEFKSELSKEIRIPLFLNGIYVRVEEKLGSANCVIGETSILPKPILDI